MTVQGHPWETGELEVGNQRILVTDPRMRKVYTLLRNRLAASNVPVLIQGETGTGKELVASAVHHWSTRSEGPFLAINCAALPDNLIESELFGHEKGAFTGADSARRGLFAEADRGTLFLDELSELSLSAQAKLLRVLESKRVRPLGQYRELEVDVRLVAATHRNLSRAVSLGTFRRDLFFRLKGACVVLPPLRRRPVELLELAERFLEQAGFRQGLAPEAERMLQTYAWPGNVRELKSAMEYLALVSDGPIDARSVDDWIHSSSDAAATGSLDLLYAEGSAHSRASFRPLSEEIAELERSRIEQALEAAQGNRTRASELIGMPLRTFSNKLKQYGLGGSLKAAMGG